MYQLTDNPDVIRCLDTGAFIPRGHWMWDQYKQWCAAGNTPLPVPPPYELHSPEHYRAIRSAAWAWMEAEVKSRGYDSIESCCSYFNSSIERYRLEARAMVAWRDAVNQALEQLVAAPPPGIETWEQVQALLPQSSSFSWPDRLELPLDKVEPSDDFIGI